MEFDAASFAYAEDMIDLDEYIFCLEKQSLSDKPVRVDFDRENLTSDQVILNFRFSKSQIYRLCDLLEFPDWLITEKGSKIKGIEGLCLLLRRLAYPQRLHDDIKLFGYSAPELSRFFNASLFHVHDRFQHLLVDLNQPWITAAEVQKWADAISDKGSPFDKCIGFIDGTNLPICRQARHTRV